MNDVSGLQTLESMSQANWYNQWSVSKFKKYLKGKILEVGCGIGNFTKKLNEYGEVYAIDKNKDYILNKDMFSKNSKAGYGDIEVGKYFFKKQFFNCIVCLNVLEHIKYDYRALKNMRSLLSDNGVLILLVPTHEFLYSEIDKRLGHYRRYKKDTLLEMVNRAGFTVLSIRRLNFLGAVGWFIAGKIFKNAYVTKNKIRLFNLIAPLSLRLEDLIEPLIGTSLLVIARRSDLS